MDRMNILFLVQEFYAIEALYVLATTVQDSGFEPMRHSHDRWLSDLREFRQKYARKLADCIYDYTVTVVAGELRHCSKNATYYLDDFFTHDDSRDSVYNNCFDYAPEEILKAGAVMFDESRVRWTSSFGGDKWKDIALAGLMRGNVCDVVFIDHCVDLSHNSNNYFDKGAGIFMMGSDPAYKAYLEHKRYCEPQCLLNTRLGYRFNRLLERANILGMVTASKPPYTLRFLTCSGEGVAVFTVICVPSGAERRTKLLLDQIERDGETIIFRLHSAEQKQHIRCDFSHYFAIPDGSCFRYYKRGCSNFGFSCSAFGYNQPDLACT